MSAVVTDRAPGKHRCVWRSTKRTDRCHRRVYTDCSLLFPLSSYTARLSGGGGEEEEEVSANLHNSAGTELEITEKNSNSIISAHSHFVELCASVCAFV